MKNYYPVPSERYGHLHLFVRQKDNLYAFLPEEDWMPVYLTYNDDGSVAFIDTEGGPCIGVGFKTNLFKVTKIEIVDGIELFTIEENDKAED